MAEISRPELCIVGAGALGIALAQHARRLGAGVMLVDRGFSEPGEDPLRAVRVASLSASASAAVAMRAGPALGLGAGDPKISMKAVQERARQVVAAQAPLVSHERLRALGIEVVSGQAQFIDPTGLKVGDQVIRPQAMVLAVGANPILPEVPGLEDIEYFTPHSILDNVRKLTHLLVIGGDPEGLALAQAYARLGSGVTVVPQGWALSGYDVEAASILMQALSDEGVRIVDGGKVRVLQPRSQGIGAVVDLADGGEMALDLSHVMVCHGHMANLGSLKLEAARLRPLRGQVGRYAIGALGQTSNGKVRVVGAAAGLDRWHHTVSHGRSVVDALVLGVPAHRPAAQPQLVLTEPALAQIGRFPADPGKLAAGHGIYRTSFAENGMAQALGKAAGLIKVLADAKGRVVAASLVGPGAAEMAAVLALAMDRDVPLEALADLPIPDPSLISSLVDLGETRLAGRTVSNWAKRRGALRRLLRL
ncbi:FAD-dependent oxidoreductase [Devosia sp. XJ19-1]|uniref:FAD-dependent oxidoreductase n=2 Tax=Devosia ureilytica TaxID=2952754 RepID=A0A9Q4AR61_9HYPH|nr:FAD-dependent oxidoreductase [Devosia ureilytica]MCP8884507.1 FAD-dependent oxidoreductase [Devosia ureilytica]MCP8888137.1 FAD-dependent oxidoreductase [Devosia ureilytica]